ncbi:MAG TPA: hypothetical protein VF880_06070 [Actinomycetes bacterium]
MWQLALLAGVWGVGIEAFQVIWDTSVQELVRPEALGRVSSLDHIGSLALLPVSFAVVGAVADHAGARPVFALAGLGAAALMCVGFLVPGVRDYRAPAPGGAEPRDARVPMLKRLAHYQDHGIPEGDQVGHRGNAQASLAGD